MSRRIIPGWTGVLARRQQPSESARDIAAIGLAAGRLLAAAADGAALPQLRFGEIHREVIEATGVDNSLFFPTINPWPTDHVAEALAQWRADLDRAKAAA